MTPLLVTTDLSKTFMRSRQVVRALGSVTLGVNEGEFVTIVGPSGCGKSTFLHIIGGFIEKSGGEVLLDGREVREPGRDRGMLFQEFVLYPWRTVLGNVGWGLEVGGRPKAEVRETASFYLDLVGLSRFRDLYPYELSGGMKQRVALARVLALNPRVLLMDEPFGSLDAQTRELMQDELTRIWQRTGKTVLFVTHDIEEAVYLGDRVVVFTATPGRVKQDLPVKLDRPRGLEIKKEEAFQHHRNLVWDLLREEVLQTAALAEDFTP